MPLGLIGRKIGMTQIFNENNEAVPVTLLELGPCTIVNIMDKKTVGYDAIQLGYDESIKETRISKPYKGQFKDGIKPSRMLKEFRLSDHKYNLGDTLKVDIFEEGSFVDVHSISKGRGFQGVVKRYGFHGGRKTHGSHFHRLPGAIGACADPSKVFKGRKLPGRMGGKKVTIQNLTIVKVDVEKNVMVIKGAIPGPNGGIITVTEAVKKTSKK